MAQTRRYRLAAPGAFVCICVCCAACATKPKSEAGTSVVVLVDFSKSFAPLTKADQNVLTAVGSSIVEMAVRQWIPPVRIIWRRIDSESSFGSNLCGPLEFDQKLINNEDDLDRTKLHDQLSTCAQTVVKLSRDPAQQAAYTDVNGALAVASETAGEEGHRVIVVFSDFLEDLEPNTKPVERPLRGEAVVLVHRPGLDLKGLTVSGYLERVDGWAKRLAKNGASKVVSIPAFGVTEHRLLEGWNAPEATPGSSVLIIDGATEPSESAMMTIAAALADLSRQWPGPVTITWASASPSAFNSIWFPPIEFSTRLIKRPGELNSKQDLQPVLEESALGISKVTAGPEPKDLAGILALSLPAMGFEKHRSLIIVSDFLDSIGTAPAVGFENTRIAMIGLPSPSDRTRQQNYFERLDRWETRFKDAKAEKVCRLQMRGLTARELSTCLR